MKHYQKKPKRGRPFIPKELQKVNDYQRISVRKKTYRNIKDQAKFAGKTIMDYLDYKIKPLKEAGHDRVKKRGRTNV